VPAVVQAALDHLAGLELIAKELYADPIAEPGDVRCAGGQLKYLLLTDWVIDRLTAAVLRRSDILGQCKTLDNQFNKRIQLGSAPSASRAAGLVNHGLIAHNVSTLPGGR
jgi:hypothetical protein